MKKSLLGIVALLSMQHVVGQEAAQPQDQAFQEALKEISAQQPRDESQEQKMQTFGRLVKYLDEARDCLSGIGCTKKQSYLANFALGGAIGFAQQLASLKSPTVGVYLGVVLLRAIANDLGYRYLVKNKVQWFRCITFRGCSDQTKRYVFYGLGLASGVLAAGLVPIKPSFALEEQGSDQPAGPSAEEESPPVVEATPVEVPWVPAERVTPSGDGEEPIPGYPGVD